MKFRVNEICIPKGHVSVSGAKNSATRLMSAALLSDETTTIYNFPCDLGDVRNKNKFITSKGANTELDFEKEIAYISGMSYGEIECYDYNLNFRTTYLLTAAELFRKGIAKIPYPGGCKIGERKYDLHIMVWEAFGAIVEEKPGYIEVRCKEMKPAKISFPISTVGGTENALLCASVVSGTTIINNAYVTPEIENLIELLTNMGAQIELSGKGFIAVKGNNNLHGATVTTIPDRIEALTWIAYAAVSAGDVLIKNIPFGLMEVPLLHLKHAGLDYFENSNGIFISENCFSSEGIEPFEIACGTHPGVISDMQPIYVLLALGAKGRSKVFDYRYPKRTGYLNELIKFVPGKLDWKDGEITVNGPANFTPASAKTTDLRGTMACILAALLAGNSEVSGVEMALRGYSRFSEKLSKLGVKIEIEDE